MFGLFKKEKREVYVAPVTGRLMPLEDLKDGVFSEKMMGEGYVIVPEENIVYAPISGIISSVFPTKHAIGITSGTGLEVLVHMGIDTVEMDCTPFETRIAAGDEVKAGDELSTINTTEIKDSGRNPAILVVFTNMNKVKDFSTISAKQVVHGDPVTTLTYAD
ncbi:PTS glucose transporter subunit IIA [Lacticaseibacillus parahuelsenbergensis]|uniref:PTS glucose transporter subunit IIA n=1 Tax=Lacticaseibacillus parahuelsenbergensis TaxID=3068305 RepID=A0ABY9L250_9LACO|nr:MULTISPECIES: PTS glucose transporter subunit IIA [Lacticaseibacillus]MDE3283715.1 PTS glucose transporter subunit IIA [Lacticaseibacillus casei]WLV77827.1 PTS glucose transporter subunit IIA [Lacticaseibacillus sp. NCIMB 15471]